MIFEDSRHDDDDDHDHDDTETPDPVQTQIPSHPGIKDPVMGIPPSDIYIYIPVLASWAVLFDTI